MSNAWSRWKAAAWLSMGVWVPLLAAGAPASLRGASVLVSPGTQAEVLDMDSGTWRRLPPSAQASRGGTTRDLWVVNRHTRELVREDGANGVEIFAWPSLKPVAAFRLQSRLRPDQNPTLTNLRASRDGQFFAAREWGRSALHSVIFDRSGRIIAQSPEQKSGELGGFDWLPDGRLLFMEGGRVFMHDLAAGKSAPLPLVMPPEAQGNGDVAASPDGSLLAFVRNVRVASSTGTPQEHSVIYLVQDGRVRPLTQPSRERIESGVSAGIYDLTWSADGKVLGFAVRVGHDRYASGLAVQGCPAAYALELSTALAQPVEIDGVRDSPFRLSAGGKPVSTCRSFGWLW